MNRKQRTAIAKCLAIVLLPLSVVSCANVKVEDPWLAEQSNRHASAATAAQKDGASEAAKMHQKKADQYQLESKKSNYGVVDLLLDTVLGAWISKDNGRGSK